MLSASFETDLGCDLTYTAETALLAYNESPAGFASSLDKGYWPHSSEKLSGLLKTVFYGG